MRGLGVNRCACGASSVDRVPIQVLQVLQMLRARCPVLRAEVRGVRLQPDFCVVSVFESRTALASAASSATSRVRCLSNSFRGRRLLADAMAYSQKIGNAIVESQ